MTVNKDTIYKNIQGEIKPFEFDERVADVFPDMINRSVPGYSQTIALLGVIANQYARENTNIYDLGCSLGASLISIANSLNNNSYHIIAVDNSSAMIGRCEKNLQRFSSHCSVELLHSDIRDIEIQNASMVVLNFTLQFLPVSQRKTLIQKIYNGLSKKGVMVVSEKIRMETAEEQKMMTELHHAFKKLNGYDDMEISAKRTALENVLVPEKLSEHEKRCKETGFSPINIVMQNLNFITYLAQK